MNPFWESNLSLPLGRQNSNWVEPNYQGNKSETRYLGRPFSRRQILLTVLIVSISFAALLMRAYSLQIVEGSSFAVLSEGNRIRSQAVLASRGVIYDRYGRALTSNEPLLSLAFIPFDIPRDDNERMDLFNIAAERIGVSREEFENVWQAIPAWRKHGVDPYPLPIPISLEDGLKTKLAAEAWPGIAVITQPRRTYKYGSEVPSLSHVVGYVGSVTEQDLEQSSDYVSEDSIGKTGIEYQYETLLKGRNGERNIEVNALGVEQKLYSETYPVTGRNLWLTIDVDLQLAVEEALRQGLARVGVSRGAVVVLDPQSGAVLALVSWPAFDANTFTGPSEGRSYAELLNDNDQPLFNRVVQGRYPSGSTIKPVIAAAALEENIIDSQSVFYSTGGIDVGRWFFPDWKTGGHGWVDVRKAIADSVNTFFYIIGGGYEKYDGLGITLIEEYAKRFGLGSTTGIDLPSEVSGLIPTPLWKQEAKSEPWYIGDTYHASIGQGDVLVTPLQVAQFTSVFANGGTLYQPHLVLESEIVHKGERERLVPVVHNDRIVSQATVDLVRQGMRQAVTEGSAVRLNSLPISSAGKTGTAELGGSKKPHGWFTGFAPYEDPEIVVTVLLEEADGSNNAMPVVYDILTWWAENRFDATREEL